VSLLINLQWFMCCGWPALAGDQKRSSQLSAMAVVALDAFLQEAGLGGYDHALRECGIRTANDILEVEQPLELLDLSYLEEQCVSPVRCFGCESRSHPPG
jgi:hypothetical protein